ncbi:MAG TPA: protein kinase, partial [Gemmatimonadales bacterium]|nr:protein kinase [Gemmatimonadales bacterium]
VMPFIEGESLRDRLRKEKQLPVEEAVRIATQVAGALDYAHRHGVVHRDIKPENILLHDGSALVADFGIALAVSRSDGGTRMTETGMSLGTPHYMSPEQAMGEREITSKSDVYALGCVLYEMLTGEPPFTGPTAQAIIARVMTEEPRSLTLQRKTIPPHVEAAVQAALAKLPADRFGSAAEFAAALGTPGMVLPGGRSAAVTAAAAAARAPRNALWRRPSVVAPWVLLLVTLGLLARERLRPAPIPPPIGRFALNLTPEVATGLTAQVISMSPDGSRIVFVGNGGAGDQLFSRSLNQVEPVPIPGTTGGANPFFSPDGTWVGFNAGTRLLKVALAGGPALPICDVDGSFWGASWGDRGEIVFADARGLMRVPASGGTPVTVAARDSTSTESYRWPEFLPGGDAVLVTATTGAVDRVAAVTLSSGVVKPFDVFGGNPHYVSSGHVLVALIDSGAALSIGTVVALPFDARRLAVTPTPVPVAESVQVGPSSRTAKMGVSRDGTLAFAAGAQGRGTLALVDAGGGVQELGTETRDFSVPALSPDGRRVAVTVNEAGSSDIWVFDRSQRILTRLTFDRTAQRPIWTPDGRRVAYSRRGSGGVDLAWIAADGSAPAESLLVAPQDQWAGAFTPDGGALVYRQGGGAGGERRHLAWVRLDGDRAPRELLRSPAFDNHSPALSPDGRWLAYVSEESGRAEVYVRPFPGPGGRAQVSNGGGTEPRWAPSGRAIFFRNGAAMMQASVRTEPAFALSETHRLFTGPFINGMIYPNYDVARDGRSFVMIRPDQASSQTVMVVLNWFANLGRQGE